MQHAALAKVFAELIEIATEMAAKFKARGDRRCGLCNRPLDRKNDRLSVDCGGDCQGCIERIEAETKRDEADADKPA